MRVLAIILFVAAIPLGIFGLWGTTTSAGNARFDEMDGIIPLAAGAIAFGLLLSSGIVWTIHKRLTRK